MKKKEEKNREEGGIGERIRQRGEEAMIGIVSISEKEVN